MAKSGQRQTEVPNERVEVEAFLLGFAFALRCVGGKRDKQVMDVARDLAMECWPPFDEPPEPTKAPRKGMKEPWEQGFHEEQRRVPEAAGNKQ